MKEEKILLNEETVVPAASSADKKYLAFGNFLTERNIQGFQLVELEDDSKIYRSNLLIDGQTLPLFVVLNNTVYSSLQVQLATVKPDKVEKCLPYLNMMNEKFTMLKYVLNPNGNIMLVCSVPTSDNAFEPALLIALVDQVKQHLEFSYEDLMKVLWQD